MAELHKFLSFCEGESESLQRLGHVLHVSSSRNLILKAEATPKIGSKVVNENFKSIGTVRDVFGPVSSPYVSVEPITSELQVSIGSILYTVPLSGRRKEKRKRGR